MLLWGTQPLHPSTLHQSKGTNLNIYLLSLLQFIWLWRGSWLVQSFPRYSFINLSGPSHQFPIFSHPFLLPLIPSMLHQRLLISRTQFALILSSVAFISIFLALPFSHFTFAYYFPPFILCLVWFWYLISLCFIANFYPVQYFHVILLSLLSLGPEFVVMNYPFLFLDCPN